MKRSHSVVTMVPKFRRSPNHQNYLELVRAATPELNEQDTEAAACVIWYQRLMRGRWYGAGSFSGYETMTPPSGAEIPIDSAVIRGIRRVTLDKYIRLLNQVE